MMLVQEPVQAAIWHCLNHYSYLDAIFLAERLFAEVDTDDALFLLATCYFRSGKPGKAYSLLNSRGGKSPQCKFLLARCCMEMNKTNEVEAAITGGYLAKSNPNDDLVTEYEDSACFVMQLLGKICNRTERPAKSAEAYKRSLKLNPFLWSSYEALCNMGENPDPTKLFQISSIENLNMCQGNNPLTSLLSRANSSECIVENQDNNISTSSPVHAVNTQTPHVTTLLLRPNSDVLGEAITPDNNTGNITSSPLGLRAKCRTMRGFNDVLTMSPLTPSFGVLPLDTPSPLESEKVTANLTYISPAASLFIETQPSDSKVGNSKTQNVRRNQLVQPNKLNVFTQSCNMSNTSKVTVTVSSPTSQTTFQPTAIANVRRSTRLFSSSNSVKENNKTASKNRMISSKTPTRKTKTRFSKNSVSQAAFNEMNEINKPETITSDKIITPSLHHIFSIQKAAAEGLMSLLRDMGRAYLLQAQYNCKQAIDAFLALPAQHLNTGWVLCNLGRAYFELGKYQEAVQMFAKVRQLEPHRMEGMEYYSTALWHLQREVALSTLTHELNDFEKDCPQSWCATGNCFSLQKEHDVAIKFFQRAVQVDPMFAYAYTLLGHEYVLTEEMDKAMSCFRTAIRIDSRHYNAWYGVGLIYYKQEKYQLAEIHYKKALAINPQSSVLMCHVGVVQHALQKPEQALATLNKAIASDPKNPLCKFHRASIYFKSDRHQDALRELEELKGISPTESLVYFQIGKVHRKLGNTHLALMNFSWAMDLDPKGANNQIKEAIDKRYNTDEDDAISSSDMSLDDVQSSRNKSSNEVDELQLQAVESDESL